MLGSQAGVISTRPWPLPQSSEADVEPGIVTASHHALVPAKKVKSLVLGGLGGVAGDDEAEGLGAAGEEEDEGLAAAGGDEAEGLAAAGDDEAEGLAAAGDDEAEGLGAAGDDEAEGLAAAGEAEADGWAGPVAPLRQTRPWALTENLVGAETRLARRASLPDSGELQSFFRRPPVSPELGLRHQKNWSVASLVLR